MEEIIIYKYQLKEIIDALRITSNIHNSSERKTSHDRSVTKSLEIARNCLNGEKDKELINKW